MKHWLRRHPLFAAEWLQIENRLRRWAGAPLQTLAVAALIVVGVASLSVLARQAAGPDTWLETLEGYWPIVLGLAALYAAMLTGRRRRSAEAQHSRSWLGAAPIPSAALAAYRVVHAYAPLLFYVLAASVLVLLLAGEAASRALPVIGFLWGGAVLGASAGWFAQLDKPHDRREDSRYTPRLRNLATLTPSLAPLSHWPMAQTFAWGRPENLRALVVVCLLLGVQAGSSALHGLLIVAVWLAGGYLSSLLLAVPRAARAASQWLRATPLAFGRFAWALARRALLHQTIGVVFLGAGVVAMGAPPALAVYCGALWLSVVALVYAISLADAYQGRSPAMKLALSFASLAAIETRFHAWSVPAALLLAAWRLRSAGR